MGKMGLTGIGPGSGCRFDGTLGTRKWALVGPGVVLTEPLAPENEPWCPKIRLTGVNDGADRAKLKVSVHLAPQNELWWIQVSFCRDPWHQKIDKIGLTGIGPGSGCRFDGTLGPRK